MRNLACSAAESLFASACIEPRSECSDVCRIKLGRPCSSNLTSRSDSMFRSLIFCWFGRGRCRHPLQIHTVPLLLASFFTCVFAPHLEQKSVEQKPHLCPQPRASCVLRHRGHNDASLGCSFVDCGGGGGVAFGTDWALTAVSVVVVGFELVVPLLWSTCLMYKPNCFSTLLYI